MIYNKNYPSLSLFDKTLNDEHVFQLHENNYNYLFIHHSNE